MMFIGIDPGKSGGMALLGPAGIVMEIEPTPVVKAGKTGRDEFDLAAIRGLLHYWARRESEGCFVTVEKSQPLPPKMGGTVANFARGVGRGWEWMCVGLGLPYQLVAPQTWQKAMHAGTPEGDTKQRSILAAHRLFPGVSLLRTERSRVPHDGLAEALLLAEFGRRVHSGGQA